MTSYGNHLFCSNQRDAGSSKLSQEADQPSIAKRGFSHVASSAGISSQPISSKSKDPVSHALTPPLMMQRFPRASTTLYWSHSIMILQHSGRKYSVATNWTKIYHARQWMGMFSIFIHLLDKYTHFQCT